MNKKATLALASAAALAASAALAGGPVIREGSVTLSQNPVNRLVAITYTLDDAPGIVTLDIETNRTETATSDDADWVSIGGENVQTVSPDDYVNALVEELGRHVIYWKADADWPDRKLKNGSIRARVTAWSTNTPPNYLVVDLTGENAPAYYTDASFLPHGGLTNNVYRERYMVMRKIPAAGVKWKMGFPEGGWLYTEASRQHPVVLTNDYYLGVFPVTMGQYANTPVSSKYSHAGYGVFHDSYTNGCPCGKIVPWKGGARGDHSLVCWPEDRHKVADGSYISNIRAKTGVDFDLPTEAQWEFACRAGCGDTFYSGVNPTGYTQEYYTRLCELAWCSSNSKQDEPKYNGTTTGAAGYHVVGQLKPNDWGLYDMLGSIHEECLDWMAPYPTDDAVVYEPEGISTEAAKELHGLTTIKSDGGESGCRVFRGGNYVGSTMSVNYRFKGSQIGSLAGCRLMCPVTLKFPEGEK